MVLVVLPLVIACPAETLEQAAKIAGVIPPVDMRPFIAFESICNHEFLGRNI